MAKKYPNEDEPAKEIKNRTVYLYLAGLVTSVAAYIGIFHLCYKDPIIDAKRHYKSTSQPTTQPTSQPASRPQKDITDNIDFLKGFGL